jgi:hypothetical protein
VNGSLVLLLTLVGFDSLPSVHLVLDGCPQVRSAELARQLTLELGEGLSVQQVDAGALNAPPTLSVTLRCRTPKWELDVDDPLTGKRLIRTLPAPPSAVERYAAVSASQLIVASWLEFLSRRDLAGGRPGAAELAETVAVRQIDPAKVPAVPQALSALAVAAEVGVVARLRQDTGGLLSLGPVVRFGFTWRPVELGMSAALELGRYQVDVGAIEAQVLTLSVDGALSLWSPRPWASLWLSARLAGGGTRLKGVPRMEMVPSAELIGFQGEVSVGLGPRFSVGRLSLRPRADLGVAFAAPRGDLPGGSVQPLGSFVALTLAVAWLF